MKRLIRCDSFVVDEQKQMYYSEEESVGQKKRRLRGEQVMALEKNFVQEKKLEPERKVKLAQEVGLQPRQVAVWFQNRRARWKNKQLQKDYTTLKSNYDVLKLNLNKLHHDNESLIKQIGELKGKLKEADQTNNDDSSAVQKKGSSISSATGDEDGGGDYFRVKLEEHNLLGEDSCSIFADDEPPSLHWYFADEWVEWDTYSQKKDKCGL